MRIKLLHGLMSGIVIALVFGFVLIPSIWKMMDKTPHIAPSAGNGVNVVEIIASVAVISVILLSFVLVRRLKD